jgi:hypothetical protein
MEQNPFWEANRFSASQGILHRFIIAFTRARLPSPILPNHINPVLDPHPTSWKSILILPSYLCLGFPSGLFPSGFPTKTLYALLFVPIRATCPAHPTLLDSISWNWIQLARNMWWAPVNTVNGLRVIKDGETVRRLSGFPERPAQCSYCTYSS